MCGYLAVLNKDLKKNSLDSLKYPMTHRGPDHIGHYSDSKNRLDIIFYRLSIIDLNGSNQPVYNQDRSVVVVFNGEIYNYKELQKYIINNEINLKSDGDAEVIAHLYDLIGPDFVDKIQGMFSIFIWDENKGVAFVYRDRFGIKPLYYAETKDKIIFCSEIKPILCFPNIGREISSVGLSQYLSYGYTLSPNTIFKEIKKLPSASYLTIANGKFHEKSYFDIQPTDTEDLSEELILSLLDDSIKLHLQADVKLGIFLSGGLDSGVLAARASTFTPHLSSYTVRFKESAIDESWIAEDIAKKYHIQHKTLDASFNDLLRPLPHILWHCDEPLADSGILPNYLVSKFAKQDGCKVVLCGTGGDEIFAGYNYYLRSPLEKKVKNVELLMRVLGKVIGGNTGMKLARSGSFESHPSFHYLGHTKIFHDFKKLSGKLVPCHKKGDWIKNFKGDNQTARLYADLNTYIPENLMFLLDRMTMAWSLEGRVPYLHHPLVERLLKIPADKRTPIGVRKGLLRSIAKNLLPESAFTLPKIGFNSPVSEWMKGDTGVKINKVLGSSSFIKRPYWDKSKVKNILKGSLNFHQKWTLFQLEMFYRVHVDNMSKPIEGMELEDLI